MRAQARPPVTEIELAKMLDDTNKQEVAMHRPMLSTLVVRSTRRHGYPGNAPKLVSQISPCACRARFLAGIEASGNRQPCPYVSAALMSCRGPTGFSSLVALSSYRIERRCRRQEPSLLLDDVQRIAGT
ncbi:MAG: hypothetical protein Q8R28_20635 [Dehalococcoidia bacterium]|nr:hypothetical protein [Dehalococcoidia bacterium]